MTKMQKFCLYRLGSMFTNTFQIKLFLRFHSSSVDPTIEAVQN